LRGRAGAGRGGVYQVRE
jgi:hypothetical protein